MEVLEIVNHYFGGCAERWTLTNPGQSEYNWTPFMGGWIVFRPGMIAPTEAEVVAKEADFEAFKAAQLVKATARNEITRLEGTISERRKREAMLGNANAIAFIQNVETAINIERAKL